MRALGRHPERGSQDRALLDELLTTVPTGVLSAVGPDGEPWAVPLLHALDGDRLLFHGSTGSGMLRGLADGAPVVYTVFIQDSWVVGPSTFSSSADYRSATLTGSLEQVTGDGKDRALEILAEAMLPGRTEEVREPTRRERAATGVLALRITEGAWLYKARTHGVGEPDERTDAWCGVVPVRRCLGEPERAPWCEADEPESVRRLVERGW